MPTTANYGWITPTVGGSTGTWGTILNTAFDAADASLRGAENEAEAAQATANAALPKAGGTMTGELTIKTAKATLVDKGAVSGAVSLDLAAGNAFKINITGPVTLSFINVPAGAWFKQIALYIFNSGSTTITWPGNVFFAGLTPPALTPGGVDVVMLVEFDTNQWLANIAKNF